ncbi:hypothetical protein F5Y08DRAFT_318057 [Xylaria arbuscula]|nr:hypothetical protein F5Y08DRAFT_318057 [Xylaria arbuscula]
MQLSLSAALLPACILTTAAALPQAGTTTCVSNPWATETSISTSATDLAPRASPASLVMKTLALCCCCLAKAPFNFDEPQPILPHPMGDCSKAGTRDVCGSTYTGSSGFAMEGLEGHPDRIGARCAVSRCGAMRFVD